MRRRLKCGRVLGQLLQESLVDRQPRLGTFRRPNLVLQPQDPGVGRLALAPPEGIGRALPGRAAGVVGAGLGQLRGRGQARVAEAVEAVRVGAGQVDAGRVDAGFLQLGDRRRPGLGLGTELGRQAGDQLGQGRRATATADPARSAGAVASAGIKNGGRSRRTIRESGV